jgi:SAM-dependent methyltransferase
LSLIYRIMYRLGFTPWDTGEVPAELRAVVEGESAPAAGPALDLGCGTGTQAVYLAQRGWRVTGVDDVEQPLRRARARGAAAGVEVRWVKADVARLGEAGLTPGYELVLDRGCFHGLPDDGRAAYARDVSALAAPGAVLLLMSFARNRIIAGPAGADRNELDTRFGPAWELTAADPDSGPDPGGPLRNVPRTWYRLRRR